MDNEAKDITYPGPRYNRGHEQHCAHFENPTEASRKGNGPRPFMGHSGPTSADTGIDRGQFSVRNVQQSGAGLVGKHLKDKP